MKKIFVLVVLFVLPIVAYLFFASGVNNFGKLPILTEGVQNVNALDASVTFQDKITVLGFLGGDVDGKKGNAFNLNQKIYKRFYEFKDFQFVMIVAKGQEKQVEALKNELRNLADIKKWRFVFADDQQIESLFQSLKTNISLDADLGTSYVFIVDKDKNLRGRTNNDEGMIYGFNTTSVAELNNMMEDDIKIILAEYRLALKKNTANR